MKLEHEIVALVYKKKAKEFGEGKNKVEYFRAILDVDDEVDEIATTQEAYDKLVTGKINRMLTQYDSKQDKYKIVGFLGIVENVPKQPNK